MKIQSLLQQYHKLFLDLIVRKNIQIPPGHYSCSYTLKLNNTLVTFRFKNPLDSNGYDIVFQNPKKTYKSKNTFLKNNQLYFYDKALNTFLIFQKKQILNAFTLKKAINDSGNQYLILEHPLSETEKERLALGKDVTVTFHVHNSRTHQCIGLAQKNMTADYSFFLGKNTLPVQLHSKLKHNFNQKLSHKD